MVIWDAEDALDAVSISDGYLDVVLSHKCGAGVEFRWLLKYAFDGVYGWLVGSGTDPMQVVDYSAVERMQELVWTILWQGFFCRAVEIGQLVESFPCHLKARAGGEVQAKAEVENCAHNERLDDAVWFPLGHFARELQAAHRVCFPEVDTFAEPVVVILTVEEGFILKELFTDDAVAAVIGEDERSRELVHDLASAEILFGLAVFAEDASIDQVLNRGFAGAGRFACDLAGSLAEGFDFLALSCCHEAEVVRRFGSAGRHKSSIAGNRGTGVLFGGY